MSNFSGNVVVGGKNVCRLVPEQNKGFKHIPDYPKSKWDSIIYKNRKSYSKNYKNRRFCAKTFQFSFAMQSLAGSWSSDSYNMVVAKGLDEGKNKGKIGG